MVPSVSIRKRESVALDRQVAVRRLDAEYRARALQRHPVPSAGRPGGFGNAWSSLGPAPITDGFYAGPNSGRIASLAYSAGTIFVGTVGGGVWNSTDGGATWTTHTDQVPTGLAIGALAVDPANPLVVYAGTGEDNNCFDCFYGSGVLKSTDGGQSWSVLNPDGIFTGASFASLVVDPRNDQKLYAGTDFGFFESVDGGVSWASPAGKFANPVDASDGVVVDPTTEPSTLYVATQGAGIEKSTDGGVNFVTLGGGLPTGSDFGFAALTIGTSSAEHPTGNRDLYAAIRRGESLDRNRATVSVFKSTDSGVTWTHVTVPPYTTKWAFDGKALPRGRGPQRPRILRQHDRYRSDRSEPCPGGRYRTHRDNRRWKHLDERERQAVLRRRHQRCSPRLPRALVRRRGSDDHR